MDSSGKSPFIQQAKKCLLPVFQENIFIISSFSKIYFACFSCDYYTDRANQHGVATEHGQNPHLLECSQACTCKSLAFSVYVPEALVRF